MAWNVLILGGGFGGLDAARKLERALPPAAAKITIVSEVNLARTYHLAMMPGIKRQIRLVVDWTVDLAFGRDTSDLGQLGHPPELELPPAGGQTAETVAR
jgi:succinate dehydrogenase/fumarate reductase flavoprotein subunit